MYGPNHVQVNCWMKVNLLKRCLGSWGRTEKHLEHLEHLMSILAHLWEIESLYFAQIKYLGKCEHPMLKSIQWLQNNNNDGYYKVKNFRPYFFEYPKLKSISFDFKVEISYWHNNVSIPYLLEHHKKAELWLIHVFVEHPILKSIPWL